MNIPDFFENIESKAIPPSRDVPDFFEEIPDLKIPKEKPDFIKEVEVKPEEKILPVEEEGFFRRLGRSFAMQAKIMPPAESLPQMVMGNLEELSLGAVDVMQPKTKGGAVMREAGKYLLAYPLMFKGLYKLLGPGGWITRIIGMGGAGGLRSSVKQYFKKGEIDPKQVRNEAVTWAALQAVGEIGATALQTKQAIDFISQRTGKSNPEVARFLARTFRNKFGKKFKTEPTAKNIELITQKNPEGVADVWKEAAETTKAMELPKPKVPPRFEVEAPKPTVVTPEKPVTKPEVPKEKPEQTLEKDPLSEALLKDNKIAEAFGKLAAKVNVEAPFKRVGADETGFRVKNYFSQISKKIDEAKVVQKEIKNLKLPKEDLSKLALASEKAIAPKDPTLKKGYKIVRNYFDETLKELKNAGVLKEGFVENRIQQIKDQIADTQEKLKKVKTAKERRKLQVELEDFREELSNVKNIKFVSIPANLWFDSKISTDPALASKVVKFLNKRKRKTATIKSLIDSGAIKPEDVDINEIVSYYARKSGRDIALGKIIKSAKKEGLATPKEIEGYVKVPGYVAPELSKYYLHPAFADYIRTYTEPKKFSAWEKLTRRTKGWSFYNPVIMPINDLYQHAALVLGDIRNIPTLGKSWTKGFKDVRKKTKDFWNAYEDGLFSQPFIPEDTSFTSLRKNISKSSSPFINMIKNVPTKFHDKLYDAIGSVAWSMDKIIRMASYNHLLKQGLTSREAAEVASLFHGDYASVPPKTRRQLNKFFWTPTFKIVMGKMQKDALKGALKVGASILKGEKVPKAESAKMKGLLGALAIIAGLDLWLTSHGFKREVFGLKYSTPITTEKGERKELFMNLSNPLNLLWKFAYRGYDAFTRPGTERNLWNFIRKNKFEYAIPTQILWELTENKKTNFEKIYEAGDDFKDKLSKSAIYSMKRIFPLLGRVDKEQQFVKPEARKAMQQELGLIPSYLPSIFPYITDRKKVRQIKAVKRIQRQFMEKAKRYRKEGKRLTQKDWQRYKDEIAKVFD